MLGCRSTGRVLAFEAKRTTGLEPATFGLGNPSRCQSSVTILTVAPASAMGAPFAADSRTLNVSFLSRLRSPITATVNRLWR